MVVRGTSLLCFLIRNTCIWSTGHVLSEVSGFYKEFRSAFLLFSLVKRQKKITQNIFRGFALVFLNNVYLKNRFQLSNFTHPSLCHHISDEWHHTSKRHHEKTREQRFALTSTHILCDLFVPGFVSSCSSYRWCQLPSNRAIRARLLPWQHGRGIIMERIEMKGRREAERRGKERWRDSCHWRMLIMRSPQSAGRRMTSV